MRKITMLVLFGALLIFGATVGCPAVQRKLLFFPTHHGDAHGLEPWNHDGVLLGYARPVASPRCVWLLLHGNAGQAADRSYAIPAFSPDDSVFILEYPGYGKRKGTPSVKSFNGAAREAYLLLRARFPGLPVCVAAESIGSGPASTLASLDPPPDKLVFVVPFDRLSLVAKDHFPSWLVGLVLRDDWDNVKALSAYTGPMDVFGAEDDEVIPVAHAKALAASRPGSRFILIPGGHNEWSRAGRVSIRYTEP